MARLALHTERLDLQALDAEDLDALGAADARVLAERTGVVFPAPVEAPPLFDDEIDFCASRLRRHPEDLGWVAWLLSLRSTHEAVGVCGLGGGPDHDGRFTVGYSIYPANQGRGYATEAMEALLAWAFSQPEAEIARASIPPWNDRSIRVAAKLAMTLAGTETDEEVGEVLVFERTRSVIP